MVRFHIVNRRNKKILMRVDAKNIKDAMDQYIRHRESGSGNWRRDIHGLNDVLVYRA